MEQKMVRFSDLPDWFKKRTDAASILAKISCKPDPDEIVAMLSKPFVACFEDWNDEYAFYTGETVEEMNGEIGYDTDRSSCEWVYSKEHGYLSTDSTDDRTPGEENEMLNGVSLGDLPAWFVNHHRAFEVLTYLEYAVSTFLDGIKDVPNMHSSSGYRFVVIHRDYNDDEWDDSSCSYDDLPETLENNMDGSSTDPELVAMIYDRYDKNFVEVSVPKMLVKPVVG